MRPALVGPTEFKSGHRDFLTSRAAPGFIVLASSRSRIASAARRSSSCRFDAVYRNLVRRFTTVPKHERVDFVVGDALDDAAPVRPVEPAWALIVVERGRDACRELYAIPSLDHLQWLPIARCPPPPRRVIDR